MIDFELEPGQRNIQMMLNHFVKTEVRPRALEADRAGKVSDEFLNKIHKMGIGGGALPQDLDPSKADDDAGQTKDKKGVKQGNRMGVLAAEEMAWGDPGVILSFPGPGLGGPPVRFTGTPEQQKKYFGIFQKDQPPRWGAYGLTEPGAGSDVANISTSCRKDGDYYVLNGRKCFITNGGRASWVVIFATLDKSKGRAAHRAFVVEKGTPGFSVGKIEKKLGLRASETAELILEDCRVHKDQLLGGEEHYERMGAGGFKTAMKTFDSTRPPVAAMATGIARASFDLCREMVKNMYLLGRPIARYQSIRDKLAEMERKIIAARLMVWHASWMADLGVPNSKEASMCKAYSGTVGKWVTREAIALVGGHGGEQEKLLEKNLRDVQVYDIFEGTGQVQRLVVSRRLMQGISIE
ncbi:MAG: acyl-CoA dehydrogenase family protein [Bdellovibrionota bacterium]